MPPGPMLGDRNVTYLLTTRLQANLTAVFPKTHLPGQLASFHRHYDRTTLIPQAPRWPRDCDQEEGGGRQSGQGRKCPAIKH
ncbi:hypothetical protein D0864_16933 [Hortaea werneckii]|uniref:Uncharacterized protein n=1 Tax=Hortaea werneckii TaxID=91943 RepID=A0A3M7ATJ8_HORWE|nr:hypothetical protein D0864_16933 [Hortaea werneckii]